MRAQHVTVEDFVYIRIIVWVGSWNNFHCQHEHERHVILYGISSTCQHERHALELGLLNSVKEKYTPRGGNNLRYIMHTDKILFVILYYIRRIIKKKRKKKNHNKVVKDSQKIMWSSNKLTRRLPLDHLWLSQQILVSSGGPKHKNF